MELREAANLKYWRVFYTMPRAEFRAEEELKEVKLEAFVPKMLVEKTVSGRKRRHEAPLFTSYLFARVDEFERRRVVSHHHVMYCVKIGDEFGKVQPFEMEQLQMAQNDPARLSRIEYDRPGIGRRVMVTEGPMKGMIGWVIEHRGQYDLVLRISAIRESVKVQVSLADVRELDDEEALDVKKRNREEPKVVRVRSWARK
ncbi:MAG: hypothetical protein EB075_06355 [Bacteroidetes bacterium]|jgi:transcription antitermination factor NusG|nr:hypothetical protein [Bacteroidota bacterium]